MQSIRQLIRDANPIGTQSSGALSQRAEDELAALLAATPDGTGATYRPLARRRRFAAVTVAAAVLAVAASGAAIFISHGGAEPPGTAAEPFYSSTKALESRADVIVRAAIRSTRVENRDGISETVATATVVASAKGGAAVDDDLEFAYTTPDSAPEAPTGLKVLGEYVLLLENRADAPAFVVNSFQGYYTVVGDTTTATRNNPVSLSVDVKKKLHLK